MTVNFITQYQRALDCYTAHDFEKFFDMAGITDPAMQMVGKDALGIAGAHYLTQIDQLAATQTRSETLKHLKRAQRASNELADSLRLVMADRAASTALMDSGVSAGRALQENMAANQDTLNILTAIFPIMADGEGYREEGLQKALRTLSDSLGQIEADAIPKARRGRGHAVAPWLNVMTFYWIEATRSIPNVGHYYSETGDYASTSLAALTFAAERLDREISSSMIATGLQTAVDAFEENPIAPIVILSSAISKVIAAKVAVSDDTTLAEWLGAPIEMIQHLGDVGPLEPDPRQEQASVSKEEFYEVVKSSESGKLLLQGLIDLDKG